MKKILLLMIMVLGTVISQAQTPALRDSAAVDLQEFFYTKGAGAITCKTFSLDGQMLMIKGYLTANPAACVDLIEFIGVKGIIHLFQNNGFVFICFEGLEQCYTEEQLLYILSL